MRLKKDRKYFKSGTTPLERLLSYIDETDPNKCWEFNGYRNEKEYGKFRFRGEKWQAHRVSYVLHKGEIGEGLLVCHACDNPPCCNPNHLWLGTHKNNMEDRVKKKRGLNGQPTKHSKYVKKEINNCAKLTKENVIEIRKRYIEEIISYRRLAEIYGVGNKTIYEVIKRISWKHIE